MRLLLLLASLVFATPAAAQLAAQPAPRTAATGTTLQLPQPPRISAGHAAALGAGMFAGAVAGSALINGGALAAAIGAVAGLGVGHWWWAEGREQLD